MNRLRTFGLAAALAVTLAACGGAAAGGPDVDPAAADIAVTASDMAFHTSTLTVQEGEAFTLALVNEDSMPHNIAILTTTKSVTLFEGELITDDTVVYDVPALEAGEYLFVCSLHPEMTGTLIVEG